MKLTRWTIALYMGLVFVCGGVVGAFGHRLYTVSGVSANAGPRNPEEFRKKFLADTKARLQLTDTQVTRMSVILDDTRKQFRETRDSIEPQMKKIREEQQRRFAEIFSPAQQAEWQKISEERERVRQNKKRGGPRP